MTFTEDHSDSMALLASGRLPQAVSAAPAVDARLPSVSTLPRIFMLLVALIITCSRPRK